MDESFFATLREQMLEEIAADVGFTRSRIGKAQFAPQVMDVMARVPRHEFVPFELIPYAYANTPLPIGFSKTTSQPFIVALMVDLLELGPEDRVLEIGTGLGYGAAVMAEIAGRVYSVEIIEELATQARNRLARLEYGERVVLRTADGYHGWVEEAPFDKIVVTAAPDLIPPPLIAQLRAGGRMVIPAGAADAQQLFLVCKDEGGSVSTQEVLPVRFAQLEREPPLYGPE